MRVINEAIGKTKRSPFTRESELLVKNISREYYQKKSSFELRKCGSRAIR